MAQTLARWTYSRICSGTEITQSPALSHSYQLRTPIIFQSYMSRNTLSKGYSPHWANVCTLGTTIVGRHGLQKNCIGLPYSVDTVQYVLPFVKSRRKFIWNVFVEVAFILAQRETWHWKLPSSLRTIWYLFWWWSVMSGDLACRPGIMNRFMTGKSIIVGKHVEYKTFPNST